MVRNYVIYKFERIKVAELVLDDSVKGWLDTALRARGLLPEHLKDKHTCANHDPETGNYLVCDGGFRPEMPIFYVETAQSERPDWSWPERSLRVWIEDDADVLCQGHVGLEAAFARLFPDEAIEPLESWDAGDAVYKLLPGGWVLIESYPGNSEIRQIIGIERK